MSSEVPTVRRPILILTQAMAASSANLTWFMDRLEWFQALLDVIICPTSCHLAIPLEQTFLDPSFLIWSDLRKANISPSHWSTGELSLHTEVCHLLQCCYKKRTTIRRSASLRKTPNCNSDRRKSVRASGPSLLASRVVTRSWQQSSLSHDDHHLFIPRNPLSAL